MHGPVQRTYLETLYALLSFARQPNIEAFYNSGDGSNPRCIPSSNPSHFPIIPIFPLAYRNKAREDCAGFVSGASTSKNEALTDSVVLTVISQSLIQNKLKILVACGNLWCLKLENIARCGLKPLNRSIAAMVFAMQAMSPIKSGPRSKPCCRCRRSWGDRARRQLRAGGQCPAVSVDHGLSVRLLPKEFPPFSTVPWFFYRWRGAGLCQTINPCPGDADTRGGRPRGRRQRSGSSTANRSRPPRRPVRAVTTLARSSKAVGATG